MRVKTLVAALALAFVAVTAGVALSTAHAKNDKGGDDEHKITLCHRTNSVKNPYVEITVDFDAATGAIKDKGHGDHTTHTGPVATSEAVAQSLKDSKTKWGDIIPAYSWPGDKHHSAGSYPGMNLPEGQSILDNHCNVPSEPDLSFDVMCVFIRDTQYVRVTLSNGANATADGTFKVNGVKVTLAPGESTHLDFADGTKIVIKEEGKVVYNNVVTCEETNPNPDVTYNLVCDNAKQNAVITFDNNGNTDSDIVLNQAQFTLLSGDSVVKTVHTGMNGVQVVISIDGKEVLNSKVTCATTGGTVTTQGTTPTTTTKSLPNTSAGSDALIAAGLAGTTALGVVLSVIRRTLLAARF